MGGGAIRNAVDENQRDEILSACERVGLVRQKMSDKQKEEIRTELGKIISAGTLYVSCYYEHDVELLVRRLRKRQ